MDEFVGMLVKFNGEIWYVDNSDEEFKDEDDETSLLLLPPRYSDLDEYHKLWNSGDFDYVGLWVYKSLVSPV